jgi:hypothetical protein
VSKCICDRIPSQKIAIQFLRDRRPVIRRAQNFRLFRSTKSFPVFHKWFHFSGAFTQRMILSSNSSFNSLFSQNTIFRCLSWGMWHHSDNSDLAHSPALPSRDPGITPWERNTFRIKNCPVFTQSLTQAFAGRLCHELTGNLKQERLEICN